MSHSKSYRRSTQPRPLRLKELLANTEKVRRCLADSDHVLTAAENGEGERVAVLHALLCILRFLGSFNPPIRSAALHRHLEAIHELFVGGTDGSLMPAQGVRRPPSQERQAQDGMIAAAVTILSECGVRKGNLTRPHACMFVSNALNENAILDRGHRFTADRVKNVYLEVRKQFNRKPKATRATAGRRPLQAVVGDLIKDRRRRLAHFVYSDILKEYRLGLASSHGPFPLTRRKKLANGLVRDIERIANRFSPR